MLTRPDLLMTAYLKQIPNSQFEHWIIDNSYFTAKQKETPLYYTIENHDIETLKYLTEKNAYHTTSINKLIEFSKIFNEDDYLLFLQSSTFIKNEDKNSIQLRKEWFECAAKKGFIHFLIAAHRLGFNIELALKNYGSIDNIKKLLPYAQQLEWMHEGQENLANGLLSKAPEEFTQTLHMLDNFHSKIEYISYKKKYPFSLFAMAKECIQDEKKSVHIDSLFKSRYFSKDLQINLLFETAMSITDKKEDNLPLQRLLKTFTNETIPIDHRLFYKEKPLLEVIVNECIKNNNIAPITVLLKNSMMKNLIKTPDEKGAYLIDAFTSNENFLPHLEFLISQGAKNHCSYDVLKTLYEKSKFRQFFLIFSSYIDINKSFSNGLTLAEYAIFDSNYSIVARSFKQGADINRGLALSGIQGVHQLKECLQRKKLYTHELRLNEELDKYTRYMKLFSVYFCDVVIDILTSSCSLNPDAWKIIIQKNHDFKDRLFEFIQSLSPETQAYIFEQSFVERTTLYIIWNTARNEGQAPTIHAGMLEKIYRANQFFKNFPQNTVEQAIEEITYYKNKLQRKNHSIDLPQLLDKKNEFYPTKKYEVNSLLPIELAILNKKTKEIFELFNPLKDHFIKPYHNDSKTYPLRYTLALFGKERLKSFMHKVLEQKESKAVILHNNLQIAIKHMDDYFEILYQDILTEKISPKIIEDIANKLPEFTERILTHARSKGTEKEYEVLKHILTEPSAMSSLLTDATYRGRSYLYERMKSLREKMEDDSKKTHSEISPCFPEDPIRNKLYITFKTLLKKYDERSNKKETTEHKHLQNQIDICHFALDILEKGKIPENILAELPERNIVTLWNYLENEYNDKHIFKKGLFLLRNNDISISLKELMIYYHKIMANVPTESPGICFADAPSLISTTPISTLVPLPEPSAPPEPKNIISKAGSIPFFSTASSIKELTNSVNDNNSSMEKVDQIKKMVTSVKPNVGVVLM